MFLSINNVLVGGKKSQDTANLIYYFILWAKCILYQILVEQQAWPHSPLLCLRESTLPLSEKTLLVTSSWNKTEKENLIWVGGGFFCLVLFSFQLYSNRRDILIVLLQKEATKSSLEKILHCRTKSSSKGVRRLNNKTNMLTPNPSLPYPATVGIWLKFRSYHA